MSKRYSRIGQHEILWDEVYFIAYAGGKRDLPEKDLKEYNRISKGAMPDLLKAKEIHKLGFDKNPNVVPISGLKLLEIIKERQFVPFFDLAFKQTKLLQVNDAIIYEAIKQKSYDIAKGI